jgi:hypothetical protein
MSDVAENINNSININDLPIEIVWIGDAGDVGMNIGNKYAQISEPRVLLLEKGFVYLRSLPQDIKIAASWDNLLSCDIPGRGVRTGCTDDPRLVEIGRKIFRGKARDLKLGTIIPPLKKE